uniref:Protein CDV3 homolog n=1 Tax=Clastoptera arizonana TaxID=38151 RepID=A0A1B6DSN7_9HEMI
MADLDDFFAKKDRKKPKGKKFSTADEMAKKLEESGKRNEKSKKDKPTTNATLDGEDPVPLPIEDEWKDFEEEKKDYTGLKIQNITLTEAEFEEGTDTGHGDEDGGMEENEAGELVPKRKVSTGPWKCISGQQQPGASSNTAINVTNVEESQQGSEDIDQRSDAEDDSVPVQSPGRGNNTASTGRKNIASSAGPGNNAAPGRANTAYIPPFARNQTQQPVSHNPVPRSLNRFMVSPDLNNEDAFPTLENANTFVIVGNWIQKKKRDENVGFEEVRNSKSHSSRLDSTSARMTTGKLTLGNKYGALTNDQS